MFSAPHIRSSLSRQRAVIALVVLTLFAQILLPIQSHTRLVKTGDGRLVVLCTLQGLVNAAVNDDGSLVDSGKLAQNTGKSAAIKFSQLLTSATPDPAFPRIPATPVIHAAPAISRLVAVAQPAFRRRPIRAPPFLTLV